MAAEPDDDSSHDALRLPLPAHDGASLARPLVTAARDAPRQELWRKFLRTRRRQHRNDLAVAYVPLVRMVAEEIASRVPKSIDAEDLVSVGVFGLLQAIEGFDPARNVKFETFCRMRIRGAMIDELRTHDRLSREARQRARDVFGARFDLRQELGREPNHHELAERARLSTAELERILARVATRQTLSLDVAISRWSTTTRRSSSGRPRRPRVARAVRGRAEERPPREHRRVPHQSGAPPDPPALPRRPHDAQDRTAARPLRVARLPAPHPAAAAPPSPLRRRGVSGAPGPEERPE